MRLCNQMSCFKKNKVVPMETTDSIIPNGMIVNCEPVRYNKAASEEGNRISTISNKVVSMNEYDHHSKSNLVLEDKSIQRVNSIVIDERSIIEGALKDGYEKLQEEYDECIQGNLGFEDCESKNDEYSIGMDDQVTIEGAVEDIIDGVEKANDNEWRQIIETNYRCFSDFEKVLKCKAKFKDKVEFILNKIIKLKIDINLDDKTISFIEEIMKPIIVNHVHQNRFNLRDDEQLTLLSIIYHISEPLLSEQLIENQKRMINKMFLKPDYKSFLIDQLSRNDYQGYQQFGGFNSFRQEFSAEKELRKSIEKNI